MKRILPIIILLLPLTLVFGQQTKIVLDSSFYYFGDDINNLDLHRNWYYKYDDRVNNIEEETNHISNSGFRYLKTYNSMELLDTLIEQEQRGTVNLNFENKYMFIHVYNNDSLLVERQVFQWENTTWNYLTTNLLSYNSDKKLITEIIGSRRNYWIYDNDGYLIEEGYDWQDIFNNWDNIIKQTYTYDTQKNLLEQTYESSTGYIQKQVYTYNFSNLRIKKVYYETNDNYILSLFYQDTLIYNNQNQLIERLTKKFDINTGLPSFPYWKSNYSYDINGNLTEELISRYFPNTSWFLHKKFGALYDNNNRIIEEYKDWFWDTLSLDWTNTTTIEYTYDNYGNISESMETHWFLNSFGVNEIFSRYLYFYDEKTVAEIEKPTTNDKCNITNPYQPFTTVNCMDLDFNKSYEIQVFDFNGKQVYTQSFDANNGFRVEKNLHQGWYIFVILEDGKLLQKQKILFF